MHISASGFQQFDSKIVFLGKKFTEEEERKLKKSQVCVEKEGIIVNGFNTNSDMI